MRGASLATPGWAWRLLTITPGMGGDKQACDALAVRLGAWYYDPHNILNIWIGGLPIEEWIWIAGVTLLFGCVTVVIAERSHQESEVRSQEPESALTPDS